MERVVTVLLKEIKICIRKIIKVFYFLSINVKIVVIKLAMN